MDMITLEQVKAEVIKLGQEQPDFVYNPNYNLESNPDNLSPFCFYNKGAIDGPECNGCIFGQALQRLGVPIKRLDGVYDSINYLLSDLGITGDVGDLVKVQAAQDIGTSWGEATKHLL
jgi:hypothetical protein